MIHGNTFDWVLSGIRLFVGGRKTENDTLNHCKLIHGNTLEWALSGISLFVKERTTKTILCVFLSAARLGTA